MSDNPLLNRPLNPKLQMTVQKGIERPDNSDLDVTIYKKKQRPPVDPALIDHGEPSLWSMLSRLFRRKAVRVTGCAVLPIGDGVQFIAIDVKYKGKQYQGILHPAKDEGMQ